MEHLAYHGECIDLVCECNLFFRFDNIATLRLNSFCEDVVKSILEQLEILDEVHPEVLQQRLDLEHCRMQRQDLVKNQHIRYQRQDPRRLHGKIFADTCLFQPNLSGGKFQDSEDVLEVKVRTLTELLTQSRNTIIYTEVRPSENEKAEGNDIEYLPHSYRMISKLAEQNLLQSWVQTGHDGLPQLANFAGDILEIYDSWRDMESGAYTDIIDKADKTVEKADLVVVLANCSAIKSVAARKLCKMAIHDYDNLGRSLGVVMISQDTTMMDDNLALKINSSCDSVFSRLLTSFGIQLDPDGQETVLLEEENILNLSPRTRKRSSASDNWGCSSPVMTADICDLNSHRDSIIDRLHRLQHIADDDPNIKDGRLFAEADDADDKPKIKDREKMAEAKINMIFTLLQISKRSIIFMEAENGSLEDHCSLEECIFSHPTQENQMRADFLKLMKNQNLIDFVVQIGHDGLPQKAGFDENQILEIYSDYSENDFFRQELESLSNACQKADFMLILVDNTLNSTACKLMENIAERSKSGLRFDDGGSLGFGLVGTMLTGEQDSLASVRIEAPATEFIRNFLALVDEEEFGHFERKCSVLEHRNFFRYILCQPSITDDVGVHGNLFHHLM